MNLEVSKEQESGQPILVSPQTEAGSASSPQAESGQPKKELDLFEMAISFVCPALLGKIMLLFFGSNFSSKPGQGYGWGLAFAIVFTLVMLGRFVWRYKDYSED